jgi:hypothetical protein
MRQTRVNINQYTRPAVPRQGPLGQIFTRLRSAQGQP